MYPQADPSWPSQPARPMLLERALAASGGVLLALVALPILETGLTWVVMADDPVRIFSGALYTVTAMVGLISTACAVWSRGYVHAFFGVTLLMFVCLWDIALRGTFYTPEDVPALAGLSACFASGVLVMLSSDVFGPLLLWGQDRYWAGLSGAPGKGRPGALGRWLARPLSLLGAAVSIAVSAGVILYAFLYQGGPGGPLEPSRTGLLYILAGCLGILGGALAAWGRGFLFTLAGSVALIVAGMWGLHAIAGDPAVAQLPAALTVQLGIASYLVLLLSFPAFDPKAELITAVPSPPLEQPAPARRAPGTTLFCSGVEEIRTYALAEELALEHDFLAVERASRRAVVEPAIDTPRTPFEVRPVQYIVEEVLVVHRDGRLIADVARGGSRTKDADLMSGMLIAIQGIVQEGLEKGGELQRIDYGENALHLATGAHVVLAAVVYGEPGAAFKEELRALVQRIEGQYAGVVEEWSGDTSIFSGVDGLVSPMVRGTEHLRRDVIRGAARERKVELLSAVDFHRGYVRLKVAAVNATADLIADAAVEVEYDAGMLRLERAEPAGVRLHGDRVTIGNIRPDERKSIAFLFDPQACQQTYIDGSVTYYNSRGFRQRVEMKRRQAEVVCPIFFTPTNANTAMLRRLIRESLHVDDSRVFRYPRGLAARDVLRTAKLAMAKGGVLLVRELVVDGPPFQSETWYYGESKARGVRMVMRLAVVEEKGVLEFYVASSHIEPITGLIAEFRRDLERVFKERYAGGARIEQERDESVMQSLRHRGLLIDSLGAAEGGF